MRVVTAQTVRPNILILLDNSQSMGYNPTDGKDFLGPDCFHGIGCTRLGGYNLTCDDNVTACSNSGTCTSGAECDRGDRNRYCPDGSECIRDGLGFCSDGTQCTALANTCKDGSACRTSCTDRRHRCLADSDCPAVQCDAGRCTTETSEEVCDENGCRTVAIRRPCNSVADCVANKCEGPDYWGVDCPSSSGSEQCAQWCADGAICTEAHCIDPSGKKTQCTQRCPTVAETCWTEPHCGDKVCDAPGQFMDSSRMGAAKNVVQSLVLASSSVANFGLMTFNQEGYFPYVSGTGPREVHYGRLLTRELMTAYGVWDTANDAPKLAFSIQGNHFQMHTYSDGGSQYQRLINNRPRVHRMPYCGTTCVTDGATWSYVGSRYLTEAKYWDNVTDVIFEPQYRGLSFTKNGREYHYYNFPFDYTGGTCYQPLTPICGPSTTVDTCDVASRNSGVVLAPIGLTAGEQAASVQSIVDWTKPSNIGGLVPTIGTPSGCSLQYAPSGSAASTVGTRHDAYSYLADLKSKDSAAACRGNAVVLLTDGEPLAGAFDNPTVCSAPACATESLTGCACRSVLAAKNLRTDLGVKTYVVGFSSEVLGSQVLDNIARAGGTCGPHGCAYYATSSEQLRASLESVVFDALHGDYATSPPSVTTTSNATYQGDITLLTSTDYPSYRGHLRAFDTVNKSGGKPVQLWDAGVLLAGREWLTRRVYTADPATGTLIPLLVNGQPNVTPLRALGFGASETETDALIRFALGYQRGWKLGAIFNSTPVSVGRTALYDVKLPGHESYRTSRATFPRMIYVGADDAMLHAFYLEPGVNGEVGGQEAWAFIPPDLLPTIASQYQRRGLDIADPSQHVLGVASSPKASDVCTGSCLASSDWKTVLVFGQGKGGGHYYALDITRDPSQDAPPFQLLWSTIRGTQSSSYLGETWSAPAFAYRTGSGGGLSTLVSFGSGYDRTLSDGIDQGSYVSIVDAATGAPVVGALHFPRPSSTLVDYAVLADAATLHDTGSPLAIASYYADLAGRLWRVDLTQSSPSARLAYAAGIDHPYYYSPAVTKLDTGYTLIAAADSTFDDLSINTPTSPSPHLAVLFERDGVVQSALTYSAPLSTLCSSGCEKGQCAGCPKFTAAARPAGSPLLLRNVDAQTKVPVQVMLVVYQPVDDTCTPGYSSLVVLDVDGTSVTQRAAYRLDAGGKSGGVTLTAGGQLAVGASGPTSGATVQLVTGAPVVASQVSGVGGYSARLMGLTEVETER
jgi:hypothetical protein